MLVFIMNQYFIGIIETVHSNILNENFYGLSRSFTLGSSGVSIEKSRALKLSCLNNEILRKGGIILFCDQLCDNMNKKATSSDVEHITWLVVTYIEHIVENIRENPVQDFVMSIHATSAPTSGLLLQAVKSKLSSIPSSALNTRFLRNVLYTIDGVHLSHSGKLIDFLLHTFLVSPHLSLTFHANTIVCGRLEILLKMTTTESANHFSMDEVATIMEAIHRKKLTKRFGKMTKLLNKLAILYNISPIEGDSTNEYGRTAFFSPGSISNTILDKNWFLGQTRVLCCLPHHQLLCNSINSRVCAKMLAALDDEQQLSEIMNLKDFNLSILNECLYISKNDNPEHNVAILKKVSEQVFIQHIKAIIRSLPTEFGFFRPRYWEPSLEDTNYSDDLESSAFQDDDMKSTIYNLLVAFMSFLTMNRTVESSTSVWDEDEALTKSLARFTVLVLEFSKRLVISQKGQYSYIYVIFRAVFDEKMAITYHTVDFNIFR